MMERGEGGGGGGRGFEEYGGVEEEEVEEVGYERFTPLLADFYKANAAEKKFEVFFVSSDRSQEDFNGYFKDMPWKALPFADSKTKAALSTKYKVSGIPTLVVLDARTGELVSDSAREGVMSNPEGFPWKPRGVWEILEEAVGAGLIKAKDGSMVDLATLRGHKGLGLHFSASWCGPCRSFAPALHKWYDTEGKKADVELLFVSSDRDQSAHDAYRADMPWLELDFSARAMKAELASLYNVSGIPTLIFIDADGKVITDDGRSRINSDPEGFPWPPKAIEPAEVSLSTINEEPTCILFLDKLTAPQDDTVAAFRAVAQKRFEDKGQRRIVFTMFTAEDEMAESIRGFVGLDKDEDGEDSVRVALLNIPEGVKVVLDSKPKPFSQEEFQTFIDGALTGAAGKMVGIRDAV